MCLRPIALPLIGASGIGQRTHDHCIECANLCGGLRRLRWIILSVGVCCRLPAYNDRRAE
jgi:hypothetical protein